MKVCLISLRALPALSEEHKHERLGGEEVQQALLAKALTKRGHDVRLIVADFGQPDGAVYEGVTTLKAFKESASTISVCAGLWAAFKRADADVYYYSCAGPILGVLAAFCNLHGKRLVYRVARDDDTDPGKVDIKRAAHRWMYHWGLKRADAVLVQTASQQRDLLKNHGLASTIAGMLVEPPGPPVAKDIDVLWVANIKPEKRPELLLELAHQMPDVTFRMVGAEMPGHEALYRFIKLWAEGRPNVTFCGAVPYRDVGALFDRARVFANTSELEGFPNTFLQSWIRGIPVVTMFDPDGLVRSKWLGSAHDSVRGMVDGLEAMRWPSGTYWSASHAALAFMASRYSEEKVLARYLNAMYGHHSVELPDATWPGVARR